MISLSTVKAVQAALQTGGSINKVSQKYGVSVCTVRIISRGKHPLQLRNKEQEEDLSDTPLFSGPARRCPTCGAKVQFPCYACYIRSLATDKKVR